MAIRKYKTTAPRIASSVYIDESAVVIGDVEIGDDSSVWPMCVLRGDSNSIRIGTRTNVQDGTVIHVTHAYSAAPSGYPVVIGDNVSIGHSVTAHGCTIEDRTLIGMGCTILDGAIVHSEVLLGAGSLVTEEQELESGYLWLGRPARRVRRLNEEEQSWFDYIAKHYQQLKDDYLDAD